MKRRSLLLLAAALAILAQQTQNAKKDETSSASSSATLDRMIAAGKDQKELAQYLFDTHGCKNCHTISQEGKLGFTEKGRQRAQQFEGCINMLTAMTVIVQLPDEKRSPHQRQKAARFTEFGCTACHTLTPGKLSLTEVGAKLKDLHLGCVDVEKLAASRVK